MLFSCSTTCEGNTYESYHQLLVDHGCAILHNVVRSESATVPALRRLRYSTMAGTDRYSIQNCCALVFSSGQHDVSHLQWRG